MHPVARKILDYGLLAAILAAAIWGLEWYKARGREKDAEAQIKSLTKAAQSRNPHVPPAIAVRNEALLAAEEYLRGLGDNTLRFERAGMVFLSAYIPTAEILPEVCAQHGVALDTFVSTYVAMHSDALARARRLSNGTPVSEAVLRQQHTATWRANSITALQQLAVSRDSTPAAECRELEDAGAQRASEENLAALLPYTYSLLFEKR